jgi:2-keto-3-deoxy-L-rhamnonate aldolase RhmA
MLYEKQGVDSMSLKFMYITNRLDVALVAEKYGVDRIWIDLETLGKEERQHNVNTVKSHHTVNDICRIAPFLTKSEMLVRVNPWNENSTQEINQVISAGTSIIMLPMWKSAVEVKNFLKAVDGRCKTTLLLETKEAVESLDEVLANGGMDEIHIGLNDLHFSYGLTFMFELLSNGLVEMLCKKIEAKGLAYGFGGIARLGTGDLVAEKVIMEHYRLHSTRAILSRSFCNTDLLTDIEEIDKVFCENLKAIRTYENIVSRLSEHYQENRNSIVGTVEKIVKLKREAHNAY